MLFSSRRAKADPVCNDYAREIELGRVIKLVAEMEGSAPTWAGESIPNDIAPKAHIKIREKGFVCRRQGQTIAGEMMTWAWAGPHDKPVFNFVSEKRDFSNSDRCLILATGFYEYTTPEKPKVKLKDQHYFSLEGEEWFWIAGIVKKNCFTMLTTAPGPDMAPYHDRQICLLAPSDGMHWLQLDRPTSDLLASPPKGMLRATTLRKDGVRIDG